MILDKELGLGSTGTVKLAMHLATQRQAAVKVVNMSDPKVKAEALNEIMVLRKLNHVNVIRIENVVKEKNWSFVFTEYLDGGDLYSLLMQHGKFTEQQALPFFRQMVGALEHAHSMHICHHDFKLENCVVSKFGDLRLIDFAYAEEFFHPLDNSLQNYHGSPAYAAPEVLFRKPHNSTVDIFSLGTSLYLMLCGCFPFIQNEATTTFQDLCTNVKHFRLEFPDFLSADCKDLLSKMITKENRISWEQIRRHPWFQPERQMPAASLCMGAPVVKVV